MARLDQISEIKKKFCIECNSELQTTFSFDGHIFCANSDCNRYGLITIRYKEED